MRRALVAGAACALVACRAAPASSVDPPNAGESPQAKAVPAPLARAMPQNTTPLAGDAGPPPVPLRADRGLSPDMLFKDVAKDLAGYSLDAVLRQVDTPPVMHANEVNTAALDAARKHTEARFAIDVSPWRARFVLATRGFVFDQGTELRARSDRYGYVLLSPHANAYRIAAPGTMRAVLGERRLDSAPLSPADIDVREGGRRLGMKTRRVAVTTRAGTGVFELAHLTELGDGGALVARFLLDLLNAPPSTPLCAQDEIPLRAELRWSTRGGLVFEAFSVTRRLDLSAANMSVPPADAVFVEVPPREVPGNTWLAPSELAAFRTSAVDVPAMPDAGRSNVEKGLFLVNPTDELLVVWMDAVPVAWVSPGSRFVLNGLLRGRYQLQWRTFLGDAAEPPRVVVVPGVSVAGGADGGVGL